MKYKSGTFNVGKKYFQVHVLDSLTNSAPLADSNLAARSNPFKGYERMGRTHLTRGREICPELTLEDQRTTEPTRIQLGTKVYQLEFNGKVFRLMHGNGKVVRHRGEPLQADTTYSIPSRPYRWKTDNRFEWKE